MHCCSMLLGHKADPAVVKVRPCLYSATIACVASKSNLQEGASALGTSDQLMRNSYIHAEVVYSQVWNIRTAGMLERQSTWATLTHPAGSAGVPSWVPSLGSGVAASSVRSGLKA